MTIPDKIAVLKLLRRREKPYGEEFSPEKVVLQYKPAERDKSIDALENELAEIDALLDEINITTDVFKYAE